MKKFFVLFIIVLFPLTSFAQTKIVGDVNELINGKPQQMTAQELKSKIVNDYGGKELKFLELKSGTLIPMSVEKANNLMDIQEEGTPIWLIVLAAVGAMLLVLILIGLAAK